MKRAYAVLLTLGFIVAFLGISQTAHAQLLGEQKVTVKEAVQVDAVGTLHVQDTYTFPASYYTSNIAPNKLNPFMIPEVRFLRSGESSKEIPKEDIKVTFDDAHSAVTVAFTAMGFTRNVDTHWDLTVSQGATLAAQTTDSVVLSSTSQDGQMTYLYTTTVSFPKGTKDIKFDGARVTYVLPGDPAPFPVAYAAAAAACAVLLAINLALKNGLVPGQRRSPAEHQDTPASPVETRR